MNKLSDDKFIQPGICEKNFQFFEAFTNSVMAEQNRIFCSPPQHIRFGMEVNMETLEELLKKEEYEEIDKLLSEQLRSNKDDIGLLMKLAMIRLQFPFEDEDTSIYYLNEIIKIEEFHFEALVIKMYLQDFCYRDMDKDFEKIISHDWKDPYRNAIADFICSWKYYDFYDEKKMEKEAHWLKKSFQTCSEFVRPFERLARIYEEKKQFAEAKECYAYALKNVISTEFSFEDAISAQAFIDEYITGVRLSSLNYESLQEYYAKAASKCK